jgi:hypothetical protein
MPVEVSKDLTTEYTEEHGKEGNWTCARVWRRTNFFDTRSSSFAPKGLNTLALGNALGSSGQITQSPERDLVSFQKCPEFLLESLRLMVFDLTLDVCPNLRHVGWAHRKCAIATLPVKSLERPAFTLYPLGRRFLNFFDNFYQSVILREQKKRMHVIFNTAYNNRRAIPLLENSGLVSE